MTPIFIFSLPRSGSTLVQRVIGAHPEVATVAEPWLLLPLFYGVKCEGITAEYDQALAAKAINEFLAKADDPGAYSRAVADMAMSLYAEVATPASARFFIDKTPRYHFIVEEIIESFPDARFVFVWRNPLAAAASMLETWSDNRFKITKYLSDLEAGLFSLVETSARQRSRACMLNYETFVTDPAAEIERIFNYLGLDHDPSVLSSFSQDSLEGSMGDPKRGDLSKVAEGSVDSWITIMNSPVRRWWCRRYLLRLGDERIEQMGYTREALLDLLRSKRLSYSRAVPDLFYLGLGTLGMYVKKFARWLLAL